MSHVTYSFRKNLGNYQHEELSVQADVPEGANLDAAVNNLIAYVRVKLGVAQGVPSEKAEQPAPSTSEVQENKEEPVKESPKTDNPKSSEPIQSDRPKRSRAPKAAKEAPAKEEVQRDPEDKGTDGAASVQEDAVDLPKKPRRTCIQYNRSLKEHTSIVASYCKTNFGPAWGSKPGITDLSIKLNGQDFLDADGNLVEEFKKQLDDFYKA